MSGASTSERDEVIVALRRQIASIEQTATSDGSPASAGGSAGPSADDDGTPQPNPEEEAFQRIVNLCSYHDFSREKMRQRLKREQVADRAAEAALDRAVACGLIDDVRYGEALCAGRMHAGRGRTGIESELWDHHIDPASIEGWPQDYELRYGSEMERALHIIERRPPRSKNPQASAYRRLLGKGYAPGVALKASRIWWNERCERGE